MTFLRGLDIDISDHPSSRQSALEQTSSSQIKVGFKAFGEHTIDDNFRPKNFNILLRNLRQVYNMSNFANEVNLPMANPPPILVIVSEIHASHFSPRTSSDLVAFAAAIFSVSNREPLNSKIS